MFTSYYCRQPFCQTDLSTQKENPSLEYGFSPYMILQGCEFSTCFDISPLYYQPFLVCLRMPALGSSVLFLWSLLLFFVLLPMHHSIKLSHHYQNASILIPTSRSMLIGIHYASSSYN